MVARVRKGDWPGITSILQGRPRSFGDDLTIKREAIVTQAPAYRQIGVIDVAPSLLLTVLAVTVAAIPIGTRSTDVAPRVPQKIQVQCEPDPLIIGQLLPTFMPVANGNSAIVSEAAKQKYVVTFEHPPNLLRKLLPDFAAVGKQLSDSAPPPKAPVTLENPRALIRWTLPDFAPAGLANSASAPITKYAVQADNWASELTTGIPAAAAVPIPPGQQVGDSSPPKYQVRADNWPTLIRVTLPDFGPVGAQLQDHETKSKYEVVALATPNLTETVLAPPAAALPIGAQISDSAWTDYKHSVTQIDDFQSLLALNPAPPPIIPPVTAPTTDQPTGGWDRRYDFLYAYERRLKHRREEERERLEALEDIESIEDATTREIAQLLKRQEAIDAERQELDRLEALVREYRKTPQTDLPSRTQKAFTRAAIQRNLSALMALDRELRRMLEEEEIAVLMLLLNED